MQMQSIPVFNADDFNPFERGRVKGKANRGRSIQVQSKDNEIMLSVLEQIF